jgi:hypothetical protein
MFIYEYDMLKCHLAFCVVRDRKKSILMPKEERKRKNSSPLIKARSTLAELMSASNVQLAFFSFYFSLNHILMCVAICLEQFANLSQKLFFLLFSNKRNKKKNVNENEMERYT